MASTTGPPHNAAVIEKIRTVTPFHVLSAEGKPASEAARTAALDALRHHQSFGGVCQNRH